MRLFHSKKFQAWYRIEVAKRMVTDSEIQRAVERMLRDETLVEVWDGNEWVAE